MTKIKLKVNSLLGFRLNSKDTVRAGGKDCARLGSKGPVDVPN